MEKTIKLKFKKLKNYKNHLDDWNHFTEDGQVGIYPEKIGKQKLVDFPLCFMEMTSRSEPKFESKSKPVKSIARQPNKMLKPFGTGKKD